MHFTHQPRMTLAQSGKCDGNAHCNHCSQNTGIALGSKLEHYTVTCNPKPRNTVSGPRLWQVALRDIQGLLAFGVPHATRCLSITTCKVRTLQKTVASPRTADSIANAKFWNNNPAMRCCGPSTALWYNISVPEQMLNHYSRIKFGIPTCGNHFC